MPLLFLNDTLILDASCIITLSASQKMEEILQSIPRQISVAAYVFDKEALFIRTIPDKNGLRGKVKINLLPFVEAGLLRVVDIESEDEAEEYVSITSSKLDRGEAITGALAIKRNWSAVIDDKRARKILAQRAEHLQLFNTLDLVKHWVELESPFDQVISQTLQSIRSGAVYSPPKEHDLYQWWHSYSGG